MSFMLYLSFIRRPTSGRGFSDIVRGARIVVSHEAPSIDRVAIVLLGPGQPIGVIRWTFRTLTSINLTVKHLDYIQGMGFDAIWISPVVGNIEGNTSYGEAYHGTFPFPRYP